MSDLEFENIIFPMEFLHYNNTDNKIQMENYSNEWMNESNERMNEWMNE